MKKIKKLNRKFFIKHKTMYVSRIYQKFIENNEKKDES